MSNKYDPILGEYRQADSSAITPWTSDINAAGYSLLNLGSLAIDGTSEAPFAIDLADGDSDYEYGIGRSADDKSWSSAQSMSFHVKTTRSFMWFTSSWTKKMELEGSTGNLRILGQLQVGATAMYLGYEGNTAFIDASGMSSPRSFVLPNANGTLVIDSDLNGYALDADVVHLIGDESIDGVKTFTSTPVVPDEAYSADWNGSNQVPTQNAIYDKIQSLPTGFDYGKSLVTSAGIFTY